MAVTLDAAGVPSPEVLVHPVATTPPGWVNFPITNPRYKNTRQGGIFVRLVTEERRAGRRSQPDWMRCPGGKCVVVYDGVLIGDDVNPPPHIPDPGPTRLVYMDTAYALQRERDFPRINEPTDNHLIEKYLSVPYLACLTLGSTQWTGYDDRALDYWHCTEQDLTDEGRALVATLRRLYEGCETRIQTWLVT